MQLLKIQKHQEYTLSRFIFLKYIIKPKKLQRGYKGCYLVDLVYLLCTSYVNKVTEYLIYF